MSPSPFAQIQKSRNIIICINCKLHSWSSGLTRFYTPKFHKLNFTPWNLVPLVIHPMISFCCWVTHHHANVFYFCQISPKTTSFKWWPSGELAQSKLRHFRPKLKTHYSSLNDTIQAKYKKSKNINHNPTNPKTTLTQSPRLVWTW